MKYFYRLGLFLGLMAQMLLRPAAAVAAPFTPGNIVIARVGDGTGALTSAATAVFLDEYKPDGTFVQSVALPTAVSGNNRALTASGTSNSELALARTVNNQGLVLAGYGTTPGTSNAAVASSAATDVVRVIGLVGADGSVNTTTSLGSAFSGSNVRSVASVDGTSFYVAGNSVSTSSNPSSAAVEYVTLGGFNPTLLYTTAPTNTRVVNIVDGNLYVSSASGSIGVSQIGTGLPTTAGQTVTLLPGSPGNVGTSNQSPYGFYFADLSPTVAGVDVLYVVDSRTSSTAGGGIQKWSLSGGTWVLNGTIANSTTSQLTGILGSVTGTAVSLYATSGTSLFSLTDNTGYNVAPAITTLPGAIATAATNTAFRGVAFAPSVPAPTITSFTPTSGLADGTVTVTITGTDFMSASAVTLNGVAITGFTVVNNTTITFAVPTGATSGPIAVTTVGGTATSTGNFTVTTPANPAPTVTSLTPSTATAGSAGFTLTVTGTGFLSSTVINFNGTALATTYVSATQVAALVPASAVATAGSFSVTATNPTPGGGTSAGVNFTVTTPAPTITSFTPTSGLADGTVTVTITGTDFTGATAVTLNGVAITGFTVVNATTITFMVPTGASSGTIAVTTPTGTATSTGTFTVTLPTPTITSLAPNTTPAGSGAFTLTVTGTGFLSGSVVNFNGTALTTTFVSATQLTAAVPATAIATAGTYNVTVTNPSANQGGTSAAVTFTVTTPAPTITSFTPTSGLADGTVTVTITGTDFTGATAVTLNGAAITGFTVVNATTITFAVPTGATSGAIAVTTPTGTATSTGTFTVTLPMPTITSLAPATAVAGGAAFTLTVTGTGFLSGSVVNFNGTALTTTFVSATQLTAAVPATAIATAGTYNVTVTNPSANQGGTSPAVTFTVTAPLPTITSFTPARAVAGTGFTLTISGTNLTAGTTVNFNGASYTGTIVGTTGTSYSVVIPASGVPAVGTYPITVTNAGGTSASLSFLVVAPATATVFEDFEQGTKGAYAAGPVTLRSGDWTFTDALLGNQFNDKVNQVQGARIRGGSIAMNFDKPTGAGVITLNAAIYGSDATASFILEISTDGGTTYSVVPGAPTALTTTLTPYSFTVNQAGNVRLRIKNTNTTSGSNPRINIDDISISNYTAPAVPTITSFTPTTGGPGTAVTLTGTNLTGATAVRIGVFTVTNFTVVNATTITFVVPTGTGSVNGLISVTTPGGTAVSTATFNLVSAALAANALPGLTVFPNPATDRLTVELPTSAPATVALRDLAGRLVLAPAALAADHQLRLPASLASGVYLLEVRQGAAVAIRRIEKN